MSTHNGHHPPELWSPTPEDADRIRERFLRDLSALDRKRHEVFDVKLQVKRHPMPLIAAAGAFAVALLTMVLVTRHRTKMRHSNHARLEALLRAWEHPERVARDGKGEDPGKKVAFGLLGAALKPFLSKAGSRLAGK